MLRQEIELDANSVRSVLNEMRDLDKQSINNLRKDMRIRVNPLGNEIAKQVPTESPFKGMNRNYYGRVQWGQPKSRVSVTPGKSTRQRGWASIVTIILENKKELGFSYTENSGPRRKAKRPQTREYKRRMDSAPRRHANTTQGDALIAKAKAVSKNNFKAGHFAYGNFLRLRPLLLQLTVKTLDDTAAKFNRKIERL